MNSRALSPIANPELALSPAPEPALAAVIAAVRALMQDWNSSFKGPIGATTTLVGDLGFESIDVVILTGDLQRRFGTRELPFERLFLSGGQSVSDLSIGALATFMAGFAAGVD